MDLLWVFSVLCFLCPCARLFIRAFQIFLFVFYTFCHLSNHVINDFSYHSLKLNETQPIPIYSTHQENPFEYPAKVFSMLEKDRSHLELNQGNMQGDLAV